MKQSLTWHTVVYKSGAKVQFQASNVAVTKVDGKITKIGWDAAHPRPLHIGVDEVAAVYVGKA